MHIADRIGRTPLIPLPCPTARLLGKLEACNPAGSVKDRAAWAMIQAARESGKLKPGGRILEATSGNTGIALAALAAGEGCRCTVCMPEDVSRERIQLLRAYGGTVILTPAAKGMAGAVQAAMEEAETDANSFYVNQFSNPANPLAHYRTTGPEIWQQSGGEVDIFVAAVGTGGTISGVGRYLKEQNPAVKIVAVTPKPGEIIPGIGAGITSAVLDRQVIDGWIAVTAAEALTALGQLARSQGILVGISAGAALHAAQMLAARPENRGKTLVTLLPDSGERYLSTGLQG